MFVPQRCLTVMYKVCSLYYRVQSCYQINDKDLNCCVINDECYSRTLNMIVTH